MQQQQLAAKDDEIRELVTSDNKVIVDLSRYVETLEQQIADRDEQISDLTISSDTYFAERNSARDVWRRASKDRDELRQQLAAAQAEAMTFEEWYGTEDFEYDSELASAAWTKGAASRDAEVAELRDQLNTFHSAVEHVTEDGCTRRSVVAMPEGWAMVHKDRLHDLTVAEEQLSEARTIIKEKEGQRQNLMEAFRRQGDSAQEEICRLRKQEALLRDACMPLVLHRHTTNDAEYRAVEQALATTDDLSGYILCEKEPVVWMQSDHLSKFIHHACGSQASLVRCSDHQLMPDFQPLYRAKEPKP